MFSLISNILLLTVLSFILILKTINVNIPIIVFEVVSWIALIPVVIAAFKALKEKEISVDFLAAVALVFAYLAKEWYSATFINLMLSSARIFSIWTERRSESLVKSLLKFKPQTAKVKDGDFIKTINVDQIKVGDIVVIGSGERIAVDGLIISGQASIDEATLTGESFPVIKRVGDHIYSSTLNTSGSLLAKTEKVAGESTLAKIISLVEKSSIKKSKTIKTVNIFARWYIIATFISAAVLYFATSNVNFVLAILLVVCADDIAVSIPLAFTAAVSSAAKKGILIKSSDVLERLPKIDVFITDKTGTLTFAKPKIFDVVIFGKMSKKGLLRNLMAAEVNSTHPIAKTIVEYNKSLNIKSPIVSKFKETPGEGIKVYFESKTIVAGKVDFLKRNQVKITKNEEMEILKYSNAGYSIVALGISGKMGGFVILEDEPRPGIKEVIEKTRHLGARLWIMLTGDSVVAANKIAKATGIDSFEANSTPQNKVDFVEKFKKENPRETIAMIGDGVNDAAALSLADISFAMGAVGSDVAINAADVALMNDDFRKIPESIELGRKTRQIVFQNFAIWGITNMIGLGLVTFGFLNPEGAATYNFLTDFVPILNALRLGRFKS